MSATATAAPPARWVSIAEAARLTSTSRFTLYARVRAGSIPAMRTSLGWLVAVPASPATAPAGENGGAA